MLKNLTLLLAAAFITIVYAVDPGKHSPSLHHSSGGLTLDNGVLRLEIDPAMGMRVYHYANGQAHTLVRAGANPYTLGVNG
ncbi:MAG TPA: hypothetical protein ENJ15_02795, partial [Caldithrix abyssi]|nr:hypothetical protein [Caldithrix abyssi]